MNKASSRPPQIRISNVKLFIFICLFVCLFVRPCIIVQSFRFELTKHKEKLFSLPPDGLESGTAPDPRTKRAQSNVRSDGERRRGDWERDIRHGMLEIDERIFLRGTNIPWTGSDSRLRRMGDLAVPFAHQGLQSLPREEGLRGYHR